MWFDPFSKRSLIVLFCWTITGALNGQTTIIDSLNRLLQQHPQRDSLRCEWLVQLAQQHAKGSNADMMHCAGELLDIARENGFTLMQYAAYNLLGIAYSRSGDNLPLALTYYDSALQIATAQTGVEWRRREAKVLFNFAGLQLASGNNAGALKSTKRSSELLRLYKDSLSLSDNYRALGQIYAALGMPDSALLCANEAMAWYKKLGNTAGIAQSYYDQGFYHRMAGNTREALPALQSSLALADSVAMPAFYLDIMNALGMTYKDLGFFSRANFFLNKALRMAGRLNLPRTKEGIHNNLADLYEKTGQLDSALAHYKQYQSLREQSLNTERLKQVQELESRFLLKDKERENALLRSEKQLLQREKTTALAVFLAVLALLALFGQYAWRSYRRRIREKTEELREFNYSVGHDLRTPVQNARLWLNHLRSDLKQRRKSEWENDLNHLEQALEQLREMLDGMARWFSLEENPPVFSSVDVSALIADVWRIQLQTSSLPFPELRIDPLPTTIRADKLMLRQVLDNLLGNAVKFSSGAENAFVRVSAVEQGAFWQFRISDNGAGFDPLRSTDLFRLFRRLHPVERFPGTGVGLAIVKRLVEKQGGTVGAESAGAGTGATFYFTLPK